MNGSAPDFLTDQDGIVSAVGSLGASQDAFRGAFLLVAVDGPDGRYSGTSPLPAPCLPIAKPYSSPILGHWDGFPQGKQVLLETLVNRPGAFLASGDCHASFVTAHHMPTMAMPVVDFTGLAISSGTFNNFVEGAIAGLQGLADMQKAAANQTLRYSASR